MHDGTFSQYQTTARSTAVYPGQGEFMGLAYAVLGLNGEAGEVAEKVKKAWRDDGEVTPERREQILKELGDLLWYAAQVATELDASLTDIARDNANKLAARKLANSLHGDGDDR